MVKIERYVPTLAGEDYNKLIVINSRGTESKKDLMKLEYIFDDNKLTIEELIKKLYSEIISLKEENQWLKLELNKTIDEKFKEQNNINQNFLNYIKENGGII